MRIALYQPDIPGNVGAILRLAACLATPVDLIEPCGFPFSDKRLRRSGMDYADHVALTRHADWPAFRAAAPGRVVLMTSRGATPLPGFRFERADTLLFGSESSGVPDDVRAVADAAIRIPMAPGLRSLNVAVSAGIALAEALRQTGGWPE